MWAGGGAGVRSRREALAPRLGGLALSKADSSYIVGHHEPPEVVRVRVGGPLPFRLRRRRARLDGADECLERDLSAFVVVHVDARRPEPEGCRDAAQLPVGALGLWQNLDDAGALGEPGRVRETGACA